MLKRLGAAVVAPVAIALLAAGPAYADHQAVSSSVLPYRDNGSRGGPSSDATNCSSSTCDSYIYLSRKLYGEFLRWCGSDTRQVVVPTGGYFATSTCFGNGPWSLQVGASLWSDTSKANSATHNSPVTVTVHALQSP